MIVWLGLIAFVFVAIVYLFVSIGGILWPGGPQLPPDAARNLSLALLLVMLLLCGVIFGGLLNLITTAVAQAEPTRIAIAQATQLAATSLPAATATPTPTMLSTPTTDTSNGDSATLIAAATQTAAAGRATRDAQATLTTREQQTAIAATVNAEATRNAATQTAMAIATMRAADDAARATANARATIDAGVRQTAIIVTLNALATNNAATQTIDARDSSGASARATVNAQATINARVIQTAVAATSNVLSTINAATQTAIANEVARTQTPFSLTATALATQSVSTGTPTARPSPTPSPTRRGTPTVTLTALPIDPIELIDTVLRGVIERANQAEIDALLTDDDRMLEPWWDEQALDRVKVNVQNVRSRYIDVTDVQWEPIGDGIRLISSTSLTATYVTSERWTFVGVINFACADGTPAQRRYVEAYPSEQYTLELRDTIISVVQWDIGPAVVQEISPPLCP
jgi:hypothetical protein